jgi:hypothetical protein
LRVVVAPRPGRSGPGGWKLDRRVSDFSVESDWAHCVSKYVGDLDSAPEWHRLGLDVTYVFAERWCADVQRLRFPSTDADYARLRGRIPDRMVAEGTLSAGEAETVRN